jgi:hypothetical protein
MALHVIVIVNIIFAAIGAIRFVDGAAAENKIKIVQSGATEPLIHMAFLDAEIPGMPHSNEYTSQKMYVCITTLRKIWKCPP